MDTSKAELLLKKYNRGEASENEMIILESWYLQQGLQSPVFSGELDYSAKKQRILNNIRAHRAIKPQRITLWPRIAAVASIVMVFAVGGYYYIKHQNSKIDRTTTYATEIPPGKVAATLTLANGKKIRLSDASKGQLAREAGVAISKTADGEVTYEAKGLPGKMGRKDNLNALNTLSTAKGETYKLQLPDGTLIWLNAASSLTYAPDLNAGKTKKRRVRLVGEGYFQVAKDKAHPFIVETGNQTIEVLGTHFNVNSYADQSGTKTTLMEGSVRVASHTANTVLSPGEQSITVKNKIFRSKVDTTIVIAWKNGYFNFKDTELTEVLKQFSRWYDVDIEYQNGIPDMKITGYINRSYTAEEALKILKYLKVNFKISDKKIVVTK